MANTHLILGSEFLYYILMIISELVSVLHVWRRRFDQPLFVQGQHEVRAHPLPHQVDRAGRQTQVRGLPIQATAILIN